MVFLAIVRPTSNGLPYAVRLLYVLSVCNVGVLWSNGWMDQDSGVTGVFGARGQKQ